MERFGEFLINCYETNQGYQKSYLSSQTSLTSLPALNIFDSPRCCTWTQDNQRIKSVKQQGNSPKRILFVLFIIRHVGDYTHRFDFVRVFWKRFVVYFDLTTQPPTTLSIFDTELTSEFDFCFVYIKRILDRNLNVIKIKIIIVELPMATLIHFFNNTLNFGTHLLLKQYISKCECVKQSPIGLTFETSFRLTNQSGIWIVGCKSVFSEKCQKIRVSSRSTKRRVFVFQTSWVSLLRGSYTCLV